MAGNCSNLDGIDTAFEVETRQQVPDKTLIIDVRAWLSSKKLSRNVLSVRNGVMSRSNIALDQVIRLPYVTPGVGGVFTASTFTYTAPADNKMVIVSSNTPVYAELTTPSGTLDLGTITLFVLTSPITQIAFTNSRNITDVELNIVNV